MAPFQNRTPVDNEEAYVEVKDALNANNIYKAHLEGKQLVSVPDTRQALRGLYVGFALLVFLKPNKNFQQENV